MKYFAELSGTFMLVLVGAGSITLQLPHFWISVAFGGIVFLMILCFGKVSGAHINPAVSLGFYLTERNTQYLYYIPFQLLGGWLAAWVVAISLDPAGQYGATLPSGSVAQTFGIETGITFILMLSIFLIAQTGKLWWIAAVVGLVVFLAAFYAGPYTGASMNPARSLGPNLVSGNAKVLWLYLTAPCLGAALAVKATIFLNRVTK